MLRKLGLWRDANSDRLLDTPTSSPAHSKENGHSKENSPKKKGNGSSGTESTTLEVRAHEQEELDVVSEVMSNNLIFKYLCSSA